MTLNTGSLVSRVIEKKPRSRLKTLFSKQKLVLPSAPPGALTEMATAAVEGCDFVVSIGSSGVSGANAKREVPSKRENVKISLRPGCLPSHPFAKPGDSARLSG